MWQDFKNIYHLGMAFLANLWFGFPSRKLTVIGVTGTDGKTTTVSLIYHILKRSKKNISMVSSIGAVILGKNYDVGFHVTTPSPFALQRFLKRAVDRAQNKKKNFLVLETTSHALDQYRVFGIKFTVGVITNITHEHLDYHKTYENYVTTKVKLLKMSKIAVINRDDESYKIVNSKLQRANKKPITYGMTKKADINPKNFLFKTKLIGEFNKYNILATIAACKALGLKESDIKSGIVSFKPPSGREEIVYPSAGSGRADFTVMVDFAHTPNAFEAILQAVRPKTSGRIIHVFGSAGLRDREKRPLMGRVSSRYADIIILTAEDPRTESIEKINREIASGIRNLKFSPRGEAGKIQNKTLLRIDDRKKAIGAGIKMAKKGDFVLITGKSHEKSMNYGHGEEPWDEFLAVKKALKLCRK